MMKTGKEIKPINLKNYNVAFGSVNNKHPKAMYINITSWANPKIEDEVNYSRVIRNLNKKIKQLVFNILSDEANYIFNKDRTIVDLDIRESGIKFGKRSFMSCELTLFISEEIPVNTEIMTTLLSNITLDVTNKIFNENETFEFHKKKK
jgi:hypothetical protein